MTYAKTILAAAALVASFGAAQAADGAVNEHEAFYKALQTPAASATVIEGRQAARIAKPAEAVQIQAPVQAQTDADRYIEMHNAGSDN